MHRRLFRWKTNTSVSRPSNFMCICGGCYYFQPRAMERVTMPLKVLFTFSTFSSIVFSLKLKFYHIFPPKLSDKQSNKSLLTNVYPAVTLLWNHIISWARNFVVWRRWTCSWTLEFQIIHYITQVNKYFGGIFNLWIPYPWKTRN